MQGIRAAMLTAALLLAGCDAGPDVSDMAGCTVSNRPITARDVADCAVERDSFDHGYRKQ